MEMVWRSAQSLLPKSKCQTAVPCGMIVSHGKCILKKPTQHEHTFMRVTSNSEMLKHSLHKPTHSKLQPSSSLNERHKTLVYTKSDTEDRMIQKRLRFFNDHLTQQMVLLVQPIEIVLHD